MRKELKLIESFGKLELKDGDFIVLKYKGQLSEKAYNNIQDFMKTSFPQNKCIVLEEGMDIGTIGANNSEHPEVKIPPGPPPKKYVIHR